MRYLFLILVVFLSSCAEKTFVEYKKSDSQEVLSSWEVRGKMSYRQLKNEKSAGGGHANLIWVQKNKDFDVTLLSSGAMLAKIYKKNNYVVLETQDKEPIIENSVDELMEKHFKWKLPIDSITYWVQGTPNPNLKITRKRKENNQLIELVQENWVLKFYNYERIKGYVLPKKIVVTSDNVSIKIIVQEWQF